jgi:hypothetical protein
LEPKKAGFEQKIKGNRGHTWVFVHRRGGACARPLKNVVRGFNLVQHRYHRLGGDEPRHYRIAIDLCLYIVGAVLVPAHIIPAPEAGINPATTKLVLADV